MTKCKLNIISTIIFLIVATGSVNGQDDLLDLLNKTEEPTTDFTIATFKNTKLISGHSIETNGKGVLQFLIGHRFGRVNGGIKELYGLDNATIRLAFDYGVSDQFNIGFARSSFQKTFDGHLKWKFFRQKSGATNFPFTATVVSGIYALGNDWPNPERENYFSSRLTFHHALLLARKFNNTLSVQIMPTVVHRNLVPTVEDNNSVVSMGIGTSIRLSGSLRFNAEYYYILPDQITSLLGGEQVRNSFSIGVDLETGGHVFQMHFTNSRGMTEKYLIGETTGSWGDGDIHFGFNVSRVFTIKKPKEF